MDNIAVVGDGEDSLLARALLLPVIGTEKGRKWLIEKVADYHNLRHLLAFRDEEGDDIVDCNAVCRAFSDTMDSYFMPYQ